MSKSQGMIDMNVFSNRQRIQKTSKGLTRRALGSIKSADFETRDPQVKDLIVSDRSRQLKKFFNVSDTTDISHVYDALYSNRMSKIKKRFDAPSVLPTSFETLKLLDSMDKRSHIDFAESKDLGQPSGRAAAVALRRWLNLMLSKGTEKTEVIYKTALKECIRQVTVHCVDRGDLLTEVIETLSTIWKNKGPEYEQLLNLERLSFNKELGIVRSKYMDKIHSLQDKYNDLMKERKESNDEKENLKAEKTQLQSQVNHLLGKLDQIYLKVKKCNKSSQVFIDNEHAATQTEAMVPLVYNVRNLRRTLTEKFTSEKFYENTKRQIDNKSDSLSEDSIEHQEKSFRMMIENASPEWAFSLGMQISNPPIETVSASTQTEDVFLQIPKKESKIKKIWSKSSDKLGSKFIKKNSVENMTNNEFYVGTLITDFINQPLAKINKYATMSKKHVLKYFVQFMYAARQKIKNLENNPSLALFVLEELNLKFSVDQLAMRKFKEIIASSVYYYAEVRAKLFLRSIGAGKLVYEKDLSAEGSLLCANCYHYILSGSPDVNEITLTKSIELLRDCVEPLVLRHQFCGLMNSLEDITVEDPFKMSKFGLVNLDLLIEKAVNVHESYRENVLDGISLLCTDYFGNHTSVRKDELLLAFRCFNPDFTNFDPFLFDFEHEIPLSALRSFCLKNKLLSLYEIEKFVNVQAVENPCDYVKNQLPKLDKGMDKIQNCRAFIEDHNHFSALLLFRILDEQANI